MVWARLFRSQRLHGRVLTKFWSGFTWVLSIFGCYFVLINYLTNIMHRCIVEFILAFALSTLCFRQVTGTIKMVLVRRIIHTLFLKHRVALCVTWDLLNILHDIIPKVQESDLKLGGLDINNSYIGYNDRTPNSRSQGLFKLFSFTNGISVFRMEMYLTIKGNICFSQFKLLI
jgi:vacuolar-type H+-ATPase subunit I/STV1